MKILPLVATVILSFLISSCQADEDFKSFWHAFKKDLLAENFENLHERTKFPLGLIGLSGHEDAQFLFEDEANKYFKMVLDSKTLAKSELDGETKVFLVKTLLERFDGIKEQVDEDHMYFENFYFQRISGRWMLTQISYDADEQSTFSDDEVVDR